MGGGAALSASSFDEARRRYRDDPVLAPLLAEVAADPLTLGLILFGSRGVGMGDAESDYDLVRVLTDEEYDRRKAAGEPLETVTEEGGRRVLELRYGSPRQLSQLASAETWVRQGMAASRILLDKTGEVARALNEALAIPPDQSREEAAACFDGYLNGFYRAMKAARRRNELGVRLQAAESLTYLVRTLFALEGRWPPFHDRLIVQLDALEGQGWGRGELRERFLAILRTGDPTLQQQLEARVEDFMRARGFAHVLDAWEGEIERVKAFRFEAP